MKFSQCVIALLLGTAIVQAAPVAQSVSPPVVAEPLAEKEGLEVSISAVRFAADNADASISGPVINLPYERPVVEVVLRNTSSHACNIPIDSAGIRQHLSLEVTNIDGKTLNSPAVIKAPYVRVGANVASLQAIAPGEVLVLELELPRPDVLQSTSTRSTAGSPTTSVEYRKATLSLRAVFATTRDYNWAEPGHKPTLVWKGRVASPLLEYEVRWSAKKI